MTLRFGLFLLPDEHLIAFDFDLKAVNASSGVVLPGTIFDAEPPRVPRAGHRIFLEVAFGQRSPHVRTKIINCVPLLAAAKNGDHAAIDRHRSALALFEIADFSDHFKFAHDLFSFPPEVGFPCVTHAFSDTL